MANLYITEQNSILRKTGDRLIVQKNDATILDVQCHKIDAVLIFGNVQFTTQAVNELLEHDIELAILSRTGRLKGQLTPPAPKNIALRIMQFQRYHDDEFRLKLSKEILKGKFLSGIHMLTMFLTNHPNLKFGDELGGLKKALVAIESADSIEQLFGIEGSAAKSYYHAYGMMFLKEFEFPGRVKRPPTDPINALLSLTYTMIFNEISSLLDGLGFDPFLGYFHHPNYGRESLGADLIEEFRSPIGDKLTLNLVNKGILKADDFYKNPKGGVYLKRESLKRYFSEYEKFLNREFQRSGETVTFRKAFRLQAQNMAKVISEDKPYIPFGTD